MPRPMLMDVEMRSGARIVTAKIDGATYEIPEAWLIGACRTMDFDEALYHWHHQAVLEAKFIAQNRRPGDVQTWRSRIV